MQTHMSKELVNRKTDANYSILEKGYLFKRIIILFMLFAVGCKEKPKEYKYCMAYVYKTVGVWLF